MIAAASMGSTSFDYRAAGERLGVRVEREVPLRTHTTMGVGGPAAWVYYPRTMEAAAAIHHALGQGPLPVRILGAGSNVIVRDEGVRAAVITTRDMRQPPEMLYERRLRVSAGQPLPGLARWAAEHELSGLEFAEGIPGHLGGALRMNAGANGGWIGDVVEEVLYAGSKGEVASRTVRAEDFSYRSSIVAAEGLFAVGAVLRLNSGKRDEIRASMKAFRNRRRETQPVTERTSGCVFVNPGVEPAGRMIDRLGLKGTAIGGAVVSETHGNFIVNRDAATARDVLALIERVQDVLRDALGREPRLEVEIWGDDE